MTPGNLRVADWQPNPYVPCKAIRGSISRQMRIRPVLPPSAYFSRPALFADISPFGREKTLPINNIAQRGGEWATGTIRTTGAFSDCGVAFVEKTTAWPRGPLTVRF